jgi:hypothetical protein
MPSFMPQQSENDATNPTFGSLADLGTELPISRKRVDLSVKFIVYVPVSCPQARAVFLHLGKPNMALAKSTR